MAGRRRVGNLLALAVLAMLTIRPMHPYGIAAALRATAKDSDLKIKWGSLYTVVGNLERHGLIEATGTSRAGRRPERTVYAVTAEGRRELAEWLSDLLGTPHREYPRFATALSLLGNLPPDEVAALLADRLRLLETDLAAQRCELTGLRETLPRLFLVEAEYRAALLQAEVDWLRTLVEELADGSFADLESWREFHRTGQLPPDMAALLDLAAPPEGAPPPDQR